jgi:hypothetical protein
MQFSEGTNNTGIVQQTRSFMRVDSNQWPTYKIVNSVNNWLDFVTGYAIGADRQFQWDDTNHTALPEGTTNLLTTTSDYSFLTDEQGNRILTLIGVSVLQNGKYVPLELIDRNDPDIDLETFGTETGTPTRYDKIADNIIRLDRKVSVQVTSGLKFYFQRSPSYFTASDTTKEPGFAPVLHRGFVIAAAYDGAMTLGLQNFEALSAEKQMETANMIKYFSIRNNDEQRRISVANHSTR